MRFAIMREGPATGQYEMERPTFYERAAADDWRDKLDAKFTVRIGSFTPSPTFRVVELAAPGGE